MSDIVEQMLKKQISIKLNEEHGLIDIIEESIMLTSDKNGKPDYTRAYENLTYKLKTAGVTMDKKDFDAYVLNREAAYEEDDGDEE